MAKKINKMPRVPQEDADPEEVAQALLTSEDGDEERLGIPTARGNTDDDIGPSTVDGEDVQYQSAEAAASAGGDDILARIEKALGSIEARGGEGPNSNSAILLLTAALEKLVAAQLSGAAQVAAATKRTTRPENQFGPGISVYNLRGDKDFPRPKPKCDFFLPWPVEKDGMDQTREELELLNLLVPGDYVVRRNDGTKVKVSVRGTYRIDSDQLDKLMVNHDTAFNNDNKSLMPYNWIRQMVEQSPKTRAAALDVLTMDEEEALILAGKLNDGTKPKDGKVVSAGE